MKKCRCGRGQLRVLDASDGAIEMASRWHQIPGGVLRNLMHHLREKGMADWIPVQCYACGRQGVQCQNCWSAWNQDWPSLGSRLTCPSCQSNLT
jgi:hypothetical protein